MENVKQTQRLEHLNRLVNNLCLMVKRLDNEWSGKAKVQGLYRAREEEVRVKLEIINRDSGDALALLWEYCDEERNEIKKESKAFSVDHSDKINERGGKGCDKTNGE